MVASLAGWWRRRRRPCTPGGPRHHHHWSCQTYVTLLSVPVAARQCGGVDPRSGRHTCVCLVRVCVCIYITWVCARKIQVSILTVKCRKDIVIRKSVVCVLSFLQTRWDKHHTQFPGNLQHFSVASYAQ